jgi:hypothetical protein
MNFEKIPVNQGLPSSSQNYGEQNQQQNNFQVNNPYVENNPFATNQNYGQWPQRPALQKEERSSSWLSLFIFFITTVIGFVLGYFYRELVGRISNVAYKTSDSFKKAMHIQKPPFNIYEQHKEFRDREPLNGITYASGKPLNEDFDNLEDDAFNEGDKD